MRRVLVYLTPVVLFATPALAGLDGPTAPVPGPGILGLVAAGVIGGIYLARRKR